MRTAIAFPLIIAAMATLQNGAHGQDKDEKKIAERIGLAIQGLQSADPITRSKNALALQNMGDVRGLRALRETLNFEDAEKVKKVIVGAIESIKKASTTFGENSVAFKVTRTNVILMKDGNVDVRGACPGGTGSISTIFKGMGAMTPLKSLKSYCKKQKLPPERIEILKPWFLEVAIPYLMKFERREYYSKEVPEMYLTEGAPIITMCRTPSAESTEVELYGNGVTVFYREDGKAVKVCVNPQKLKDAIDLENYSEEEKEWFEKKAYPKLKELSEKLPQPK